MKDKLKLILMDNYINYIDDCLAFLLAVERGLQPKHTVDYVIKSCYSAGLIGYDKHTESYVYRGEDSSPKYGGFQWVVDEYIQLFLDAGMPKTDRYEKNTVTRMKKFFSEYPEIRKDEVILGTKIYVTKVANEGSISFVRQPRYFIFKGNIQESDLMAYIQYMKEENNKFKGVEENTLPSNIRIQ